MRFREALGAPGFGAIAEFKRRSPSAGDLRPDGDAVQNAQQLAHPRNRRAGLRVAGTSWLWHEASCRDAAPRAIRAVTQFGDYLRYLEAARRRGRYSTEHPRCART